MNRVKRRVAIFADVLEENFDGVSVTLHKILKNAPKDRFEYLVITSHPPKDLDSIPHKLVLCKYIKLPFQKGYRLGTPGKEVERELDAFNPDLIHFTSPSLFGRFALKYGKRNGIPVMNIYHTHYPAYWKYYLGKFGGVLLGWCLNLIITWFYKRADLTLTPTKPIKMDLIKLGVPARKMKIWGRAIETGSFHPGFREERLFEEFVPKTNKKVLFVSRLIKEKNMVVVQRVYKKLMKSGQNVSVIITGDGPMKEWLQSKMPKAVFTGKKTGEELAKIYASCDVFYFPSSSETFGNVVIEAMASGLPVVSADAGGPQELVRHGKNGYLIDPENDEEFAKRILELTSSEELRSQMGANAREFVESRSIDNLHELLWDHYENTIQRYHAAKRHLSKVEVSQSLSTTEAYIQS